MKSTENSLLFYIKHYPNHQWLQIILLFIEYIPIIFISLSSPSIIYQYFHSPTPSLTTSYILFKLELTIPLPNLIDSILSIIIICILLILLIGNLFTHFFNYHAFKEETWKTKPLNSFYCIIYDLLFFRSLSFYIIYMIFLVIIDNATKTNSAYFILTFGGFIILGWYMIKMYNHINKHCVIIHLENNHLANERLYYPFDWCFSRNYDIVMIGFKTLCAIDALLLQSTNKDEQFLLMLFNCATIIYIIIYFMYLSYNILIKIHMEWFIFNRLYVFIRITIVSFLFFTIILYIIFLSASPSNILLGSICFISFFWSIICTMVIWKYIILRQLFNGRITLVKMLYMLLNTTNTLLFQISSGKIIESFECEYRLFIPIVTNSSSDVIVSINKDKEKSPDGISLSNTPIQEINIYPKTKEDEETKFKTSQLHLIQLLSIYHICKKKKSKSSLNFMENSIDYIYSDMLKLLYYFSKGKLYKYYTNYSLMVKKYTHLSSTILLNIHFIIEVFLSKTEEHTPLFIDIFSDTKLQILIENSLKSLKHLIKTPKELMQPVFFFTLANDINHLKEESKASILRMEQNENKVFKEQSAKTMSQVNKYSLMIHRFLIESLINKTLCKTNQLEMDYLEDYLLFHYTNDKTLLMSASINDLSLSQELQTWKILKCGPELIKYDKQSISLIFPNQFRQEGIQLFSQLLLSYLNDNAIKGNYYNSNDNNNNPSLQLYEDSANNMTFKFVINSTFAHYIELFYYSFRIVPTLINNQMLINGIYTNNQKMIMIFKENNLTDELTLEALSPSLENLIIITPDWIEHTKKNHYPLHFTDIFVKYEVKTKNDEDYNFDCIFNNVQFATFILKQTDFNNSNLFFTQNYTITQHEELKEKLLETKDSKEMNIKVSLTFQFSIKVNTNITYRIFSVVSGRSYYAIARNLSNSSQGEKDNNDNHMYMIEQVKTVNSGGGSSVFSGSEHNKKKRPNTVKDSNGNDISKTFNKFSLLILIFNCFMITVCIIFLIIQIIQSQELYKVNQLYYQFKTIQINFANTFLNVFSNICIADLNTNDCSNAYQDYSNTLHQLIPTINPKYNVRTFIISAIQYQINALQSQYNIYRDSIHSFGDQSLIQILETKMSYVLLGQENNIVTQTVIQITLEEGLQKFINSLAILYKAQGGFDSPVYPMHIISVRLLHVDFDNIFDKNLNEVQSEIYKIVINYINYSSGYSYGEQLLLNAFNKKEELKKQTLYWYIALIIILHLIVLILCRWIMVIVQKLLTMILQGIITRINIKELNSYYIEKIDSLLILNDLYVNNPNNIIHRLHKYKRDILQWKVAKNKEKKALLNHKESNKEDSNEDNNNGILSKNNPKKDNKESAISAIEMKKILQPLLNKIYVLFLIFFIFVAIFDYFLLKTFNDVVKTNQYVFSNVCLETQIYNNVALPQIMTLVNMTQIDLAKGLGENNVTIDGILNMKIREAIAYKDVIFYQEHNNPSLFPSIDSFFDYNCSSIYSKIQDNITVLIGQQLGADYIPFQIEMCKRFKITNLTNYEYLYNDHNYRAQSLQNFLATFSYSELYNFNQLFDFFELYTLTMVITRPLRSYIRENILYKKNDQMFQNFLIMISGYLAFNIIADIIVFLVIKVIILGRINFIHSNLLGLNKCLLIDDR